MVLNRDTMNTLVNNIECYASLNLKVALTNQNLFGFYSNSAALNYMAIKNTINIIHIQTKQRKEIASM